jgi:hypothetical protein
MAFPLLKTETLGSLKLCFVCKKTPKPQYYQQYCGENLKTDDTSYHENEKNTVSEF